MPKSAKSTRARMSAEKLFPSLKATPPNKGARPKDYKSPFASEDSNVQRTRHHTERPFKDDFEQLRESEEDAAHVVTVPRGIEIPTGYDSIDHVREAMRRAWRIEWGNFELHTVDISLPHGWQVTGPKEGPHHIVDQSGTPRAGFDNRHALSTLHLLTRYWIDQEFHPKDRYCQLLVRDRAYGIVLEKSYWAPEAGTEHPEWLRIQSWMDQHCPNHRDPLQEWEDCEENNDQWIDLVEH
ncbi:hypothetical protein [Burkholderia sp. WAC0059]|uniref:hypothetical protein n=1 Tax=Burkholderia sp. WAC0059 TaxID=2066022 RepID=UPI0011AF1374|nr:hypothetical protein [Burkholderia sp. WAC0059]